MLVGELPWWFEIRFCTCSDCEIASLGLRGVWETHGLASREEGPVGVGVRSLESTFDKTASGSARGLRRELAGSHIHAKNAP